MKVEQNVKSQKCYNGKERVRKLEDLSGKPHIQKNRKMLQKENRENGGEGIFLLFLGKNSWNSKTSISKGIIHHAPSTENDKRLT